MFNLTKLIYVGEIENDKISDTNCRRKYLTTSDSVFVRSIDELRHFRRKGKDCTKSVTDFALAVGVAQSDEYVSPDGLLSGTMVTRTPDYVAENGVSVIKDASSNTSFTQSVKMGVCPVLKLDLQQFGAYNASTDNSIQIKQEQVDGEIRHYVEIGEYPKSLVDVGLGQNLERLYNNGQLQSGIEATGRFYTANGDTSRQGFSTMQIPEFIYNGEKYVRVVKKTNATNVVFANGEPVNEEICWIKVEPIKFIIANWGDLPKSINYKGKGRAKFIELEADQLILGGIPYAQTTRQYDRLWQNSLLRAFLNSSNLQLMDGNEEYKSSNRFDFTKSGFLYQAFNLTREPITEFAVPLNETCICKNAYAGCVSLKRLIIHNDITEIDKEAFSGCDFKYAYTDPETGNLIFSQDLPQNETECQNLIKLSDLHKAFYRFEYSELVNANKFAKYIKLANLLSKAGVTLTFNMAKDFVNSFMYYKIISSGDMRFFKNEVLSVKDSLGRHITPTTQSCLFKCAYMFGCFSTEAIKNKNGEPTQVLLAQKASSFLAGALKQGVITKSELLTIFLDAPIAFAPNQDFLKFISMQGSGKTYPNLQLLLKLEKEKPGIFVKVMTQFSKVQSLRTVLDANGKPINLSWEEAILKFYNQNRYYGVTDENIDIADVFIEKGLNQSEFMVASDIREQATRANMTHHILGEELKEETILESIERIKSSTEYMLQDSKTIIDDLYAKKFTYEMLDKYDPRNAILGIYCSCCATITSHYYGKEIAIASMTSDDVQNLVVRDSKGEIIAKGTLYVNRENGYVVINDFEINEKYKNHEFNTGYYDVSKGSQEEQERQMIFNAFMRGIYAFVEKYDEKNPDNPINYVTVGGGFNRLKRQCDKFNKATKLLTVPEHYCFDDACNMQYVLYDRRKHQLNKQAQGGRE